MRLRFALLCCCCGLTLFNPRPADAAVNYGYATGSGANTASLVVDFAFIDGDAYLFEYRFDGQATAEDMLLALDEAGGLTVHHQFFEFEIEGELVRSIFIDGFSYDGMSSVPVFEGDEGENWSLWIADDRVAAPGFWTPASIGASDRLLQHGAYDGWTLNVSPFNTGGHDPTSFPPAVPIPGDTDGDGDIDDADLGTLVSNFTGPISEANAKTFAQGDTDHDGDVDDADLGTVIARFTGQTTPTQVPEPAGLLVFAIGCGVLALKRN